MKFPAGTVDGVNVRVLLVRPDMSRGRTVRVEHRLDTKIGLGRTDIEERQPGRAKMLLTQTCTLTVANNAADDWRKGLAALGSLPVAIPLWIDALPVARWGERIYDPLQVINFDPDTDAFEIMAAADLPGDLGELDHPLLAPLLVGRWEKRPSADAITKKTGDNIEVRIEEASPYSCRIGVNAHGSSWAALPDRTSPPRDTSEFPLELIRLSAAREPGLDRVNTAARWLQEGDFLFRSRLEIRQHLTFFDSRRGAWESWSPVPAWFQPGADTEATPDDYTARFASDVLTLEYISGAAARARVGFLQEIDTGVRSQALPAESHLYSLSYWHDLENPDLFTAWDAPVVGSEGTFLPTQIAHQDIIRSLRPQDVKAEVSIAFEAGSLLHDFDRQRLFGPLVLRIWKCDPDDVAATRKQLFSGQVVSVLPEGNLYRVTAKPGILDRKIATWTYGPRCNVTVFSQLCGLAEDDFDSAATLLPTSLSPDGKTVTLEDAAGWGGSTYDEGWFAGGMLRTGSGRPGSGVGKQIVTIMTSEMDGTDLVLTLQRPLWPDMIAGGGQAVQLLPGCDRQASTCQDKFDNFAPATAGRGFRGMPYIPDYLEEVATSAPKPKK